MRRDELYHTASGVAGVVQSLMLRIMHECKCAEDVRRVEVSALRTGAQWWWVFGDVMVVDL
mgnify:CR=1 FL=1